MKAYKICFYDIKGLIYTEELTPYEAMNLILSDYPM